MNDTEKRALIERLRGMVRDHTGRSDYDVVMTAADALEATLWRPIADMPDELKDGRNVFVWRPASEYYEAHADVDRFDKGKLHCSDGRLASPTRYQQITTPEDE